MVLVMRSSNECMGHKRCRQESVQSRHEIRIMITVFLITARRAGLVTIEFRRGVEGSTEVCMMYDVVRTYV